MAGTLALTQGRNIQAPAEQAVPDLHGRPAGDVLPDLRRSRTRPAYGVSFAAFYMVGDGHVRRLQRSVQQQHDPISQERKDGWIRQLRLTPLPANAYVVAKVLASMVTTVPSIVIVFLLGRFYGHVQMPTGSGSVCAVTIWFGTLIFAALAVALGYKLEPDSVQPVTIVVFFFFSILGGLWFPLTGALQKFGEFTPTYQVVKISTDVIGQGTVVPGQRDRPRGLARDLRRAGHLRGPLHRRDRLNQRRTRPARGPGRDRGNVAAWKGGEVRWRQGPGPSPPKPPATGRTRRRSRPRAPGRPAHGRLQRPHVPGTGSPLRWFFSGIWLVYLVQPVSELFGHHHGVVWIAGGLAITVAFCAIYMPVLMYRTSSRGWPGTGSRPRRAGGAGLRGVRQGLDAAVDLRVRRHRHGARGRARRAAGGHCSGSPVSAPATCSSAGSPTRPHELPGRAAAGRCWSAWP